MSIDRVGMKQVVLHPSDDSPKGGDIATQHTIRIHPPQLVRYPHGCADDLEKQSMITGILTKLLVYQPKVASPRAHRGGPHAIDVRVLLQQYEQLEYGRGCPCKNITAHRLE